MFEFNTQDVVDATFEQTAASRVKEEAMVVTMCGTPQKHRSKIMNALFGHFNSFDDLVKVGPARGGEADFPQREDL
jgi:hypothetical protein